MYSCLLGAWECWLAQHLPCSFGDGHDFCPGVQLKRDYLPVYRDFRGPRLVFVCRHRVEECRVNGFSVLDSRYCSLAALRAVVSYTLAAVVLRVPRWTFLPRVSLLATPATPSSLLLMSRVGLSVGAASLVVPPATSVRAAPLPARVTRRLLLADSVDVLFFERLLLLMNCLSLANGLFRFFQRQVLIHLQPLRECRILDSDNKATSDHLLLEWPVLAAVS